MKSSNLRKAMFAGSWYPASAADCAREISDFLAEGQTIQATDRRLVGGIVPHAGWYFSGSIACNVISRLKGNDAPDVIVVFGMHLHPNSKCYLMAEGAWETPLGEIPVEERLAAALAKKFSFVLETPDRFNQDNTIELQLPFIKHFFENSKIVAMGVPPTRSSLDIGKSVIDLTKEMGLTAKVIGSTDLTHYGSNYGFASRGRGRQALDWVRSENDRRIIDAMLALEPQNVINEALASQNACCAGAAATAIEAAKNLGADQADEIAYATSYDKSPGDSFVGYVGIVM
ncbi:dioxygenase [Alkalispirochaeta odontotermitis]|nr:dioxygenase [Alkalispirochaeta odontotermitis]CAB1076333.1 COG1355, Predicted dioxygenase [Olavius algarvensis Delta 1 endosymbiont]